MNIDLIECVIFSESSLYCCLICLLKMGLSRGLWVEFVVQSSVCPCTHKHVFPHNSCISTQPRAQLKQKVRQSQWQRAWTHSFQGILAFKKIQVHYEAPCPPSKNKFCLFYGTYSQQLSTSRNIKRQDQSSLYMTMLLSLVIKLIVLYFLKCLYVSYRFSIHIFSATSTGKCKAS